MIWDKSYIIDRRTPDVQNFEIEFYELPDGQIPVQQFLSSLDLKMRAKAIKTIQLLENNGN